MPQPPVSFSVIAAAPVIAGWWVQSGHASNTATATITDYEVQETIDLADNAGTTVTPANSNANTETVALLQQITDFPNGTRQVGSGHHIGSFHSSQWITYFQEGGDIYELKQLTSDIMPWMWGTDLDSTCGVCNHDYTTMVAKMTEHYGNGGAGMTNIHARCPNDQIEFRWDDPQCVDIEQLITPATPEYNDWRDMLDEYAVGLQALEDNGVPILIRPFHEFNRTRYWWSYHNNTQTTARFITLWQQTFDYLVTTKGLDNLLFIWGPTLGAGLSPAGTENYWPGDDYVDFIGLSNYRGSTWDAGDQTDLDSYISFASTHDKPIFFAEGFANGADEPNLFDNADVLTWLNSNPEIAYFMFWDGNKAPYNYPNPDTIFNDSLIYNRPVN
jgi:mannan endo-1,4-beta-mannosidase